MSIPSLNTGLERSALRTALESAGFLVFEPFREAREGERLRQFWAALILLDLPVRQWGGLEILRRLRGPGDDVPRTIALTHGCPVVCPAIVKLGTVEVLARPLPLETAHSVIEQILRPAAAAAGASPCILVAVDPFLLDLLRAKQALDRREFADAEQVLRAAIALHPESAAAFNLMGMLQYSLGQHAAAYQAFQSALRTDSEDETARENLRRYCTNPESGTPGSPRKPYSPAA